MFKAMNTKTDLWSKFLDISKQTGIPLKKVGDFFFVLKKEGALENNLLLTKIGVSKNALSQIKELSQDLLLPTGPKTSLTSEALSAIDSVFNSDYEVEEKMFKFLENDSFKEIKEFFEARIHRPSPKREYDQFTATVETVAKRAALLDFFTDIKGKRIALVGDDDFTSVALALANQPEQVTVFEIDERIINTINEVSKEKNLNIEIVEYDARKRIPKEYQEKFDVIFTDPPYTPDGISLFLSRGVELLDKSNQSSRVYLCYGNSDRAKERFLPIQRIFTDSGIILRWVFDKFNRYTGAESIGNTSSLYVGDITPQTHPIIQGEFNEKIYTL